MKTFHFTTNSTVLLGDLHTPVSLYLKVRDIYPQSVLLESSDFHAHDNARSFIAIEPIASIAINRGTCISTFPDDTSRETVVSTENPVDR